jgi:hypothetical protein
VRLHNQQYHDCIGGGVVTILSNDAKMPTIHRRTSRNRISSPSVVSSWWLSSSRICVKGAALLFLAFVVWSNRTVDSSETASNNDRMLLLSSTNANDVSVNYATEKTTSRMSSLRPASIVTFVDHRKPLDDATNPPQPSQANPNQSPPSPIPVAAAMVEEKAQSRSAMRPSNPLSNKTLDEWRDTYNQG